MANLDSMTREELLAYVNKLEQAEPSNYLKVSPKGGVSLYGLGRFPVTLYRSQWKTLFSKKAEIESFIEAHADKLASKPVAEAE